MRDEAYTFCGCKDEYLDGSQGLGWFCKVVDVGSPLKFMASLILDSWLGIQYQLTH